MCFSTQKVFVFLLSFAIFVTILPAEQWYFLPNFSHDIKGLEAVPERPSSFHKDLPRQILPLKQHEGKLSNEQSKLLRWHTVSFPHRDFVDMMPERNVFGWYACTFDVPRQFMGQDVVIDMGIIDDADDTFINGIGLASTGTVPGSSVWQKDRVYRIPSGSLRRKGNYLAVHIWSLWGLGGIAGFPVLKAALAPKGATWEVAFIDDSQLKEMDLNTAVTSTDALKALFANSIPPQWRNAALPWNEYSNWKENMHYAAFRLSFEMKDKKGRPFRLKGQHILDIGPVFDVAALYLNGKRLGLTGFFPQNSMPAFTEAAKRGCCIVETDDWSRDGHNELLVVVYRERGIGGLPGIPGILLENPVKLPFRPSFTALCTADIDIVADVNQDGQINDADNGTVSQQDNTELEMTSPGLIITVKSDADTLQDAAARLTEIRLVPRNLDIVSALPENQAATPAEQAPKMWLEYDSTLLEIFDARENGNAIASGQALPYNSTMTVFARGIRTPLQNEGSKYITARYASKLFSCDDAVLVTVLDLNPTMDNGGYLLVNDDNDDAGNGASPVNVTKDMNQSGPLNFEDDELKQALFPMDFSRLGSYATQCSLVFSIEGTGQVHLFADNLKNGPIAIGTTVSNLDTSGNGKSVALEGLSPSGTMKGTRLVGTWQVAQRQLRAVLPLTILEMRMAVDSGKRRGEKNNIIYFDDFGTVNVPGDFGYYRSVFWVNDDHDTIHYETDSLDDDDWHEDDNSVPYQGATNANCDDDKIGARGYTTRTVHNHDGSHTVYVPPSESENHCLRDLEDFNRLHLKLDQLFTQLPNVQFKMSGAPVNLFKAIDEGIVYVTNKTKGEDQIKERRILAVNTTDAVNLASEHLVFNGGISPFIWEARFKGKYTLNLILYIDGIEIGRKKVLLDLHIISDFFDEWKAQTTNDPKKKIKSQTSDDYILLVHGYNMTDEEKRDWVATMYKRLWWQGFKGRAGIFSWPCEVFSLNLRTYDNSDYKAWNHGTNLKNLLEYLQNGDCSRKVHLLAHSQGNVVAGSALRLLPTSKN